MMANIAHCFLVFLHLSGYIHLLSFDLYLDFKFYGAEILFAKGM